MMKEKERGSIYIYTKQRHVHGKVSLLLDTGLGVKQSIDTHDQLQAVGHEMLPSPY